MRRSFASLVLLTALAACAGPSSTGDDRPAQERRPPTKDALRRLHDLAPGVIVGTVESFEDPPTGRVYKVRVEEVLSLRPADEAQRASHPLAHDATVEVTTFLFQDGATREIGALEELSRYVFFLAPQETAGEWLNLADPAAHRLPEAQDTLDALRALRDQPLSSPGGAQERPPG